MSNKRKHETTARRSGSVAIDNSKNPRRYETMRRVTFILLAAGILVISPTVVAAQDQTVTTTKHGESSYSVELRSATVLTTYGNHVVVENQDGEHIDFEVSDDYRFNIDGRRLRASELKPGTKISAMVQTRESTQTVVTTTIRQGEVLHVMGRTVIVRGPEGVRKVVVPSDFIFDVEGEEKTVDQLRTGMRFTTTIVSESAPATITERQLASEISGTAPPTRRAAAAPSKPAPAARPATLPATGSLLPLIGLLGVVSLLLGTAIAVIRRQ